MRGARTEEYLAAVRKELPPGLAVRDSAIRDLRAHLEAAIEAGATEEDALARMGSPAEVAAALLEEYPPAIAPLGRRLGAFLIDAGLGWAVVIVLVGTIGPMAGGTPVLPSAFAIAWIVAAGVLSILYFPVLEAVFGQTVGKRMLGLRVVTERGRPVGWKGAILRRLPLFFEFFILDAIFAPFTEKKQRAFDMVAGTVVVSGGERPRPALAVLLGLALWLLPLLPLFLGRW